MSDDERTAVLVGRGAARRAGTEVDLARALTVLGVLLAVVVTTSGVVRSSLAVVTATTSNEGNSITTSTITLDADVASALFDVVDLAPGDSERRCVEVTYEGTTSSPSPVRLFVGGMADERGLAGHLRMRVVETGGSVGCDGAADGDVVLDEVLADAARTHVDHMSGVGRWTPTSPTETRAYVVEVTLDRDTPTRFNGARIDDLRLVWEVTA